MSCNHKERESMRSASHGRCRCSTQSASAGLRTSSTPPPLHGSSLPLLNTILDAVSIFLPPQFVAAQRGRGTTRHLSQHIFFVASDHSSVDSAPKALSQK